MGCLPYQVQDFWYHHMTHRVPCREIDTAPWLGKPFPPGFLQHQPRCVQASCPGVLAVAICCKVSLAILNGRSCFWNLMKFKIWHMWLSGFVKCDVHSILFQLLSILFDNIAFFTHHTLPVTGCGSVIPGNGNTTSTPTPVLETKMIMTDSCRSIQMPTWLPSFQLVPRCPEARNDSPVPHKVTTWPQGIQNRLRLKGLH